MAPEQGIRVGVMERDPDLRLTGQDSIQRLAESAAPIASQNDLASFE